MQRIRPLPAAVALALLPACGLLLGPEREWRFGEPPPPPPRTGYVVEGEVRDFATFAPVPGAQLVLTTERPGYARRALSDASGRFSIGFSALAREVTPCEAAAEQLVTGNDPSNDIVSKFTLRVTAPGRLPVAVTYSIFGFPAPLVVGMERAVVDAAIPPIPLTLPSGRRL